MPRERLHTALDSATQDGGITVLVAPAGAGKTLGVAGWLQHRDRRHEAVWVSRPDAVTVADLEALTQLRDDAGAPRLVVIDDAHELTPSAVAWLDGELDRNPDQLDVLLLSRWDLPLTRLVHELLGTLTVLRGSLLKLDEEETALLVRGHARNDSPELARVISARTRGWCAAVVLAAKAVADRPDPVLAARELATNVGILDRVAREAFAALTPEQRHVLLCVAAERFVTASEAVRLTADPAAGSVLEQLESTGLAVTRYEDPLPFLWPHVPGAGATAAAVGTGEPTYVVHPLLRELSRRRLVAGGKDVERARSTVHDAVEQDLGRGELTDALRRLAGVGADEAFVRTLADHGPAIVLSGHASEVNAFVNLMPGVVERAPGCWFTLALERWESGDVTRARDWLERIFRARGTGQEDDAVRGSAPQLDAVCALALRGHLGDEPLPRVVMEGAVALEDPRADAGDWARLSLLRFLVGTALVRLGDLEAGESLLAEVADTDGTAARSPALLTRATAQLALTQLMRGADHTVSRLTLVVPAHQDHMRAAGLGIARQLVALTTLPAPADSGEVPEEPPGDPLAHVLLHVLRSRRLLVEGRAAEAQRVLQTGLATVGTPTPLRGTVRLEEALQATLTGDRDVLRTVAGQLRDLGMLGDAALVDGFRADLSYDLVKAAELFATAAETAVLRQPPAVALAHVMRAQVLDALGRRAEASEALLEAVAVTEVRRNLLPFLGWSRHGRPIADLLRELTAQHPTAWGQELTETVAGRTPLVSLAGVMTATPREQAHVPEGTMFVSLSPRERDVLHELARGATYADIAANLFLSENTVKTHVSSVYAKLAVNRRSDALAVARTLHLV